MKKKICHLTSVHPRYDIRVFIKECQSLAQNGFDVSLVVADGLGDEVKEGVKIYDVGAVNSRKERILKARKKVFLKAKELKCDIYQFHDPELMFLGLKLRKNGVKVIYDIHEDLTKQIKIKPWIHKSLRGIISFFFEKVENFVVKKVDAVVVPQPYMYSVYSKKNKNTTLVENFVILQSKNATLENINYANKTCFHAGALSLERGVLNMVRAFSKINDGSDLVLAGNINDVTLNQCKEELGWNQTKYLGIIPYESVLEQYNNSSIGLILYNNVGQYYLSYAIKLFEYMLKGMPVIMPNFGEWVSFNEENNCGINVDPTNTDQVANAIMYLNKNPELKKKLGENGKKAVIEKYNWSIAEKRLMELYKSI
ncbi:glycosyltransferase [Pseudofulvibacter geojedonensis]|uniref:Glycosyltransferase n=1 Tax=Pseudofulvibacter geojedonensis TaxID=1123758 RepID=A0ABW3I489_9FLAO